MTIKELIQRVELLKAEIEWEKSLEHQITLEEVLRILRLIESDK